MEMKNMKESRNKEEERMNRLLTLPEQAGLCRPNFYKTPITPLTAHPLMCCHSSSSSSSSSSGGGGAFLF